MENHICQICGAELPDGAVKCPSCGVSLLEQVLVKQKTVKKVRLFSNQKKSFVVKSFILLALSIFLFISAFLPICQLRFNSLGTSSAVSIRISAPRAVTLFFDSLYRLDSDDLLDSKLAEKTKEQFVAFMEDVLELKKGELNELFGSDDEVLQWLFDVTEGSDSNSSELELSPKQQKKLEGLMWNTLRLSFKSEESKLTVFTVLSMLLSILYIGISAALLVLSLLNVIFIMLGKLPLFNVCARLLPMLPLVTVLDYYILLGYGGGVFGERIGVFALLSCIFCVLFAIYLLIERIILIKEIDMGKIIKNSLSLACAIAVLFLIFAPVYGARITTVFKGNTSEKTVKLKPSPAFFADIGSDCTENDPSVEEVKYLFESFSTYKRSELREGEADMLHADFVTVLAQKGLKNAFIPLFSSIYYLLFAVGVFAGIIAVQNLHFFCTGRKSRMTVIIGKILSVFAAIAALGVLIGFVCLIGYVTTRLKLGEGYDPMITASPIVLSLLCIALACIPSRDVRVIYRTEESPWETTQE